VDDVALTKAGIANFNLMALTSIIPPGTVIAEPGTFKGDGIGQILPVVVATSAGRGHHVAALGWVCSPEGGLLFEAASKNTGAVIQDITCGLQDMTRKRSWNFSDISYRIQEADYSAGCALVAAVFVIPRPQFLEWFWTSPSTGGVHPGE